MIEFLESWRTRLVRAWLGWGFQRRRADYYAYLAVLVGQGEGRKTLLEIFEDDARRYGTRHQRGVLSAHWARQFRRCGGDLGQTFEGTLPDDELALLRAAQLAGGDALARGLADLAQTARLLDRARSALLATLGAALVACGTGLVMVLATPLYTVPTLQHTFQVVPAAFHGPRTRALFGVAGWLEPWLPMVLLTLLGVPVLVALSLPWLTGPLRRVLDRHLVWRVYRDFQGVRFLALLGSLVRPRGNLGLSLRDALLAQWPGSRRWKRWHLQQMLERVDDGATDARTFATGLLDREIFWFLSDMLAMHGMDQGLLHTRQRLQDQWLEHLLQRAHRLRWALMLLALGVLFGLMFWHYAVIDELRRALQMFYATRS